MKIILGGVSSLLITLIIALSAVQTANAQLDTTFGTNGTVVTDFSGEDRLIESFVLPDNKILAFVAGTLNGQTRYYLARYNSNGTLDGGYGANGIKQLSYASMPNAVFTKAARQSNGTIILSGSEGANSLVVGLNEDGTLNTNFAGGIQRPNFNPAGDDKIDALGIQPDGKIVVSSAFDAFSSSYLALARYLPDGTLDSTFGDGGIVNYPNFVPNVLVKLDEILFQLNGKIIVKGKDIRRFNADGRVDNSFTIISNPYDSEEIVSVLIQPDDKILLSGRVYKTAALRQVHTDIRIARYTGEGISDTSFGSGGVADLDITNYFNDAPVSLAIAPDGQILVGGNTFVPANRSEVFGYKLSLARLTANGQVTGKFLVADSNTSRGNLKILADGKILTTNIKSSPFNDNSDLLLTRSVAVPLRSYYFKGTPFDFVYNSYQPAAAADLAVFRPANSKWYFDPNAADGTTFGTPNDIRVPSDYVGNFATELAYFRPSSGTWYIATDYGTFAPPNVIAVQWGQSGDIPVPADYDGDGKSDIAVFRPSSGVWYIRYSSDNSFNAYQFGTAGDKPVAGDYDGDHKADIAVFRPSSGIWYVLKSSAGFTATQFGTSEDIPVQEDYDGDGKTDIAVWRPSGGYWYRLNSGDGSFSAFAWGQSGDKPVPADYDGDLKTDIAVWRPSDAIWYIFRSRDNSFSTSIWGTTSDMPVPERK